MKGIPINNANYCNKLNINPRANLIGAKPTGKNTTINTHPLNKVDGYFILNGAVSYEFVKELTGQVVVDNILNAEYYDPGVRSADGNYYAARIPRNERNLMVKLIFN